MTSRCEVVITSNPLNHNGGVVAFYGHFMKNFEEYHFVLRHLPLGSRMEYYYSPLKKRLLYPLYYVRDVTSLAWFLFRNKRVRIVQVNPSLIPVPLIRDGFVILLAKLMRRKSVVLFHGWKTHTAEYLRHHRIARWLFRQVYGRCDAAVVLASRFRDEFCELAVPRASVHVTTTMYDVKEIMPTKDRTNSPLRFVFLGRISEIKGVTEIIDAARIVSELGKQFEFVMVGDGDRAGVVEGFQAKVKEYELDRQFRFTGRLNGNDKFRELADSDVYVFPSWTEGCPNSVLEALGAGLFVISTDVGALKDIIREGENGRIVRLKDPKHLAELMEWACNNVQDLRYRRVAIQHEAEARYDAKIICEQFQDIYRELIDGK